MTTKDIQVWICAILATALETEPSFFPESHGYIAIGCNLSEWTSVKKIMVDAGLITIESGPTIALTPKGRELAQKIEKAVKAT